MSIDRRWNRNEVSRESPDKEVNRRPTSLKKFRADALRGPRVSIATGWNIKSRGREEYLVSFLFEAVSAALPAEWDVECRYESARVLTTVTSHVSGLPPCHGINVSSRGGRQKLILEIITLMINHPSGSHQQSSRAAVETLYRNGNSREQIAGFTVVAGYRRDFLPKP